MGILQRIMRLKLHPKIVRAHVQSLVLEVVILFRPLAVDWRKLQHHIVHLRIMRELAQRLIQQWAVKTHDVVADPALRPPCRIPLICGAT